MPWTFNVVQGVERISAYGDEALQYARDNHPDDDHRGPQWGALARFHQARPSSSGSPDRFAARVSNRSARRISAATLGISRAVLAAGSLVQNLRWRAGTTPPLPFEQSRVRGSDIVVQLHCPGALSRAIAAEQPGLGLDDGCGEEIPASPRAGWIRVIRRRPACWQLQLRYRDLLVGNFSFVTSEINAFDPLTAAFQGTITIDVGPGDTPGGLWALNFGSSAGNGGDANILYFNVGINGEQNGLFAALVVPEPSSRRIRHASS